MNRVGLFKLLTVLIFLLIVGGAYLLLYHLHVRGLYGYKEIRSRDYVTPNFPKLTDEQMANLGWAHADNGEASTLTNQYPKSSYLNFDFEKPDSITRIGIFGGSFTEGTESGYGLDFPSLLQDRLNAAGYDHIQVINFGVGSYGMHQSYLLYEYLGRKYNLDIVVLNPTSGHRTRDNRFIYSNNYIGVHGRYILDHDSLKYIPVKGKNRQDAARIYHNIFEDERYVKYDMRTPNFFEAFITDYNPYYYTGMTSPDETDPEIFKTYGLIFESLASEVKQVVVMCNDDDFYVLKDSVQSDNILFYKSARVFEKTTYSLYTAPCSHLSPFGNQFRADELFNVLTGSKDSIPVLTMLPSENVGYQIPEKMLDEFDSLFIDFGAFRYQTLYSKSGKDEYDFCNEPIDLKTLGAKCLLLLPAENGEIIFLPLNFYPQNKENISLNLGSKSLTIRQITPINPYVFAAPKAFDYEYSHISLAVIRTQNDEYFNIHQSKKKGQAELILKSGNKEKKYPLFEWTIKKQPFHPEYSKPIGNLIN